jgi:diacylglycerol kinase family enzyme
MAEKIAVVINAGAGCKYDAPWADDLTAKFAEADLDVAVTLARDGAQMLSVARAAVAAGARVVVAGGGDGTINAVASVVAGTECALGVLPLGTLNHFAKDLAIPLELAEAIAVIRRNEAGTVDLAEVNGKVFLNNSGLGMYPEIVRDREHQQQRLGRGKWLAFASATLGALRRYPFMTVRMTLDGREQVRRTPFLFIGNNEYSISGFTLGQRDGLRAGVLSVYCAQRTSRLGLVRLALRSLFGRLRQAQDFDALLTHELVIETGRHRLPVSTDGEVNWMQTPLHYRIRPRALRVLLPAAPPAPGPDRPVDATAGAPPT